VTLSNAIGTGVADDKSIYPYVPEMIRFYLGEEPILNNVPTYMCRKPEDLAYTGWHLPELVVKEVHGAGGGMLVGPASTKEQIETFRRYLEANPEKYIAQPHAGPFELSDLRRERCCAAPSGPAPLRAFGAQLVPGGLTRVALREGSLVVNSSQGGGTKDTWVLEA
jgi:uncharacterized circularly permuted ATP-grasp superfamily protein